MRTTADARSEEPPEGPWAPGAEGPWIEVSLRRTEEATPLLDEVTATLSGLGCPPRVCMGVRLALEEAVVNGLRHGNRGDPAKRLRVRYRIGPEGVVAEIEEEGAGFDPSRVPDPTQPEFLDRPGGRGLMLMRHYMTWVLFSSRGNRVTLCKRFAAEAEPLGGK
jgi:serine/threonine-protein kinase RsbW